MRPLSEPTEWQPEALQLPFAEVASIGSVSGHLLAETVAGNAMVCAV